MNKVSIIIPTYKRAERLNVAIDSVLNQTYENIEIIVVDDNDANSIYRKETECFMQRYGDNSKVVYIKHEKNLNGAAARNTGIKHASGDFIGFLDDDDRFLPNKIEKQVTFLMENKEFQGVYCGKIRNQEEIIPEHSGDLTINYLKGEISIGTPTLLIRREAVLSLNGFDESFRRHQDVEFLLRFFEKYRLGFVKDVLVVIGENDGENMLKGRNLDALKRMFFQTFSSKIKEINKSHKNFEKEVYSIHYSYVFLSHIKCGYILRALKVYIRFLFYCPIIFNLQILKKIEGYKKGIRKKKSE